MLRNPIPLYKVHMPPEACTSLRDVLYSGQISHGPNVARFEKLLQDYIGNPRILTTGDISSSITLALYMAGVRPGDEVLASPMACLATNIPIKNLFAKVVWCDVDPRSGNIAVSGLETHITSRTKAILVYHWAGNPVDLDPIIYIARRHGILVVEDAGEALGAEYKGKKIGNNGTDFTVYSFYPNRGITTGEGAAIAFGFEEEYERGRWLRKYGIHQPSFRDFLGEINPLSNIPTAGFNTSMNHLAATIGMTQMNHLPRIVETHQENGSFYDRALQDIPGITLIERQKYTKSAYWVYTLQAERRDDLLRFLREKSIYASKVHMRNDIYACFESKGVDLPGVDHFQAHTLSIPCGWWVTKEEREQICHFIKSGW